MTVGRGVFVFCVSRQQERCGVAVLRAGRASCIDVRFPPKSGRVQCHHQCRLSAMCGRLPVGKSFFRGDARLVGAAMCPAFRCGAYPWPLAIMLSARLGPGQKPAVKSCRGTSGVSRSPDRPAGCIILVLPFPTSLARVKRASLKLTAEQALCSVCR